ncbi:MAG: hypothetical protein JW846_10630 [Dehalococcoidia bacterium]|nr:hypothetical protein [Dehalococcoidia bacterium]
MAENNRTGNTSAVPQGTGRSLPERIQLVVGLLLGSGMAGTAIGFIGKEGFQSWGLTTLIVCLLFAAALLVWSERVVDRREREGRSTETAARLAGLGQLNSRYVYSLKTTGQYLAMRLEMLKRGGAESEKIAPSEVLSFLANDLRNQAQGMLVEGTSEELVKIFREGIGSISDEWQELAEKGVSLEEGPPIGAEPV